MQTRYTTVGGRLHVHHQLGHALAIASSEENTYSKFRDGSSDSSIPHVLFTEEVGINTTLAVSYHQE